MNFFKTILDMLKNMKFGITIPLGTFSKKNSPTVKLDTEVTIPNTNTKIAASGTLSIPSEVKMKQDGGVIKENLGDVKETPPPVKPLTTSESFVRKLFPIAEEIHTTFGIHPFITITQAAHESAWGVSGLTKEANNLFGYTGDTWAEQKRPVIWKNTQEHVNGKWITVRRPFRKYESWLLSVQDWAINISGRARYQLAYEAAKKGDMIVFAKEVHAAGYATDPNYPLKLIDMHHVVTGIAKKIANV